MMLQKPVSHFLLGISSTFPLASHLALPGSESVFGISQGSPLCTACLWILLKRPMGGWHHFLWGYVPSLLTSRRLSVHMWLGGSPWFGGWGLCDLLSLIWTRLSFPSLLLFWDICPQGTDSGCSAWGPSVPCLSTVSPSAPWAALAFILPVFLPYADLCLLLLASCMYHLDPRLLHSSAHMAWPVDSLPEAGHW